MIALLGAGRSHVDENNCLGATLGNVLVLQLLRAREPVNLIVAPGRLDAELVTGVRRDDTKATSGNVLEAIVKTIKVFSVDEEDTKGRLLVCSDHEVCIHTQRKGTTIRHEQIRSLRLFHCVHHLEKYSASRLIRQSTDSLLQLPHLIVKVCGLSRLGVERRAEEIRNVGRIPRVVRIPNNAAQVRTRKGERVELAQWPVKHRAQGRENLGTIQTHLRTRAECQVQRRLVQPLDTPKIPSQLLPKR
mmetsp:Transcript_27998/g.73863  ORF Transcript_27998/g.73863 Transcript_27998/m.73863 type:complete len:246 (-) Transcript_27998:1046-1783(-)